jgi:2-oxoglutarate ferredoxin oxidoreductase subunit beta
VLHLRKLAKDYDPTDRIGAMNHLQERHALGEVVTGLLYVDSGAEDMHRHLNTVEKPLNQLGDAYLCPGNKALAGINASLR